MKNPEENKINARKALLAFDKIREFGNKTEEGYKLLGITAITSHDGYTITLQDQHVSMFVYFHNKFNIDYKNRVELESFVDAVNKVLRYQGK